MSIRRAAPGAQLSQGRLRVDAARAIKKLREYQLADRAAWVLEGIRAAVAAGATEIRLDGDANDIWLGWHGLPWDAETLPRLFDELVSPEVSDDKQAVRLLAAAVNSALGMDPAYVDVYAITAAGTAQRARYTPEVLAEPENELGDAPLRHVAVEPAQPPTEVIHKGMLVHLRRRASLSLLSYWIGEPPELPLARAACRDIGIPLVVDGSVLQRDARTDLVCVPLEDGLDGFIAITHEDVDPQTCFEVAERGVVLARYELQLIGFDAKRPIPVRVFLDAPRLPTNVSRAQVRRDVHPIATAERRARLVMTSVIQKLALLVTDAPADVARKARAAALSLLASAVGGHPVGWPHLPALLAPLGELPLVSNAFGERRKVTNRWVSYIHTEKKPLEKDLDPWIDEVLWAPPDDDVRRLLAGYKVDVTAMRRHARWARQQRRAHQKFLAHSKRELKVQTSTHPRVRVSAGVMVERSCVPQDWFADVNGEICVYDESRNAAVVLCVEGRELDRIELTSAIAFDAVLDSKRLTPGERYRGVMRDEGFAFVDRAMRAGVVRAIESIASDKPHDPEVDIALVRTALVLARDLDLGLTGPLVHAPAWRRVGGGYVSYAELEAQPYIGVIAEGQALQPPAGRVIVHANGDARDQLRRLFGNRVISYHKAVDVKRASLETLAERMPRRGRVACLIVRDDAQSGVISIASGQGTLYLHHYGVPLGERPYQWTLLRTSLAIDSDAITPNDKWTAVVDDAGLGARSFEPWERALVCAIVQRLVGDDVPDLVEPSTVVVGDVNFELLLDLLANHEPVKLLGEPLLERLMGFPLFRRLGELEHVSVRDLATAHPQGIFYVESDEGGVDDFAPVIASERTAMRFISRLARHPVHDGKHELTRRKKLALKKQRVAEHLALPEEPLQLDSELPTVAFRGKTVRGLITFGVAAPQLQIRIDNRPFRAFTQHPLPYPIRAVVDLGMEHTTDSFDGIPNLTLTEIHDDMAAAVPGLLEEIAKTRPELLGEPGPVRSTLWAFLQTGTITNELRDVLRKAPGFRTIQGAYVSIASVEDPSSSFLVAAFGDDWLAPDAGENPTLHDAPILRVNRPVDELHWIIGKLHMDGLTDVTAEVNRLQARRRMARGLLPTPKLPNVPAELKKPLQAFGELTKRLGHGEVGFASSSVATLLIHEQGQLQRTMDIDVMPAILLAIESPHEVLDHGAMVRVAQDLAVEMVRTSLPQDLPPTLRQNLARAVLARRVPPAAVQSTPLFWCTNGTWIDWKTFAAQLDTYDDVWALTEVLPGREPLDPKRVVILLDGADIELAKKNGFNVINARHEIELDTRARANMARAKASRLELPTRDGVLAQVELEGNGKTGPRGIVAALLPHAAGTRGTYAHRGMHPFDRGNDVCRWPTIAVVDDARITPDRTWTAPKGDDTWAAITKEIRAASERALAMVGEAPGAALAELRVTSHVCSDIKALREAPRTLIRGVLWLNSAPYVTNTVAFRHAGGLRTIVPANGLAVGGTLAVFTEDDLDIGVAIQQLCEVAHGKLARMLLKDQDVDRDLAAAHVAHAIATNTVKPTEVNGIAFTCFEPKPLLPRQLASLFRRSDSVPIVKRGTSDIAETAFVDDGTELAKIVRTHLGERLTKAAPLPKPAPPKPAPKPPVSTLRPAPVGDERVPERPKPAALRPKPRKPHVLQPLVDALSTRVGKLGIHMVRWDISENIDEPMFAYVGNELVVAGANARLRAVAADVVAESVRAEPAIDALAAHVVNELNVARADITDASELHALGVLLRSR